MKQILEKPFGVEQDGWSHSVNPGVWKPAKKENNSEKIIYVAGPYRGKTIIHVLRNIFIAWRESYKWWKKGYTVICPHTNSLLMSELWLGKGIDFILCDLEIVKRCDIIVMLPRWKKSAGAIAEYNYAKMQGKEVIYA